MACSYELVEVRTALQRDLAAMRERIEFVRREVLSEMKHDGLGAIVNSAGSQIRSPEKLAAAKLRGLKINLGCGHLPLEGYINIDSRDLPGVDIVAEARDLPLPDASVQEIFVPHILQHFPQEELRLQLLPYWHGLLMKDGAFRAVVPDGEAMLTAVAAGQYPFEDFREALFGTQGYSGAFHHNLFTPDSLKGLLQEAGYCDVRVPVRARRNGKGYEFEIAALKL
jgi:hypothetical protein